MAMATPVQPYNTTGVPYAVGGICLDGGADAAYGTEQSTDWMYPDQQAAYSGPNDFTAVFHLAYDLEYLYILAIMTDDVKENYDWSYSEPWMFDNIEVFLQLDTNTSYTAYDSLTVQLRFCRGLDSVQEPGRASRSDFGYYMEDEAPGGWITEVAIPWTCALGYGMAPEDALDYIICSAIGFDLSGADSDDTDGEPTIGNRDYQTAWDLDGQTGMEDQAWQNVRVFGYVSFQGCENDIIYQDRDEDIKPGILIVPNPAQNTLFFNIEGLQKIEIYSITGLRLKVAETDGPVDISDLKSGLYVARIGNESVRFVKE
jgi:hypothetical protein